MALVCPKCNGSFENQLQCPKCKVILVVASSVSQGGGPGSLSTFAMNDSLKHGSAPVGPPSPATEAPASSKWYDTPFGRFMGCLFLSLGLSYGLLQLCVIILQSMGKGAKGAPVDPRVLLGLFYGLQATALLTGGFLAGLGRRAGAGYGAMVGLVSGGVVLGLVMSPLLKNNLLLPFLGDLLTVKPDMHLKWKGIPYQMVYFYGIPVAHFLCGLVGGLFGSMIWKPPPEMPEPTLAPFQPARPMSSLETAIPLSDKPEGEEESYFGGSIAWMRVIFGTGIAAGGVVWSKKVIDFIVGVSEGHLKVDDMQQQWVTQAEIFALSIFIGGTIGGATTANGPKQGIVVGVGAGILQAILTMNDSEFRSLLPFVIISSIFLAPLGGWFGTNLMPPALPPRLEDKPSW